MSDSKNKSGKTIPFAPDPGPMTAQEKVDEAAIESFPASDPPAFTGAAGSPAMASAPRIVVPPLPEPHCESKRSQH